MSIIYRFLDTLIELLLYISRLVYTLPFLCCCFSVLSRTQIGQCSPLLATYIPYLFVCMLAPPKDRSRIRRA